MGEILRLESPSNQEAGWTAIGVSGIIRLEGESGSPIHLQDVVIGTIDEVVSCFAEEADMRRDAVLKPAANIAENAAVRSEVAVVVEAV